MSILEKDRPSNTVPPTTAREVRHVLSAGLSFIGTSMNSLLGKRPDPVQAKKMFKIGEEKLRAAIAGLDLASEWPDSEARSLGYNSTVEHIYTSDHAEVAKWTLKFKDFVNDANLFSDIAAVSGDPQNLCLAVGSNWHAFSTFVPWFLCQAAANVSTNEKRHYVIQTAFEELGMRNSQEIHADMFWDPVSKAGVSFKKRDEICALPFSKEPLQFLREKILGYETDEEVLGILLGLEIPAIENIETVLKSLSYNSELKKALTQHPFFRLHRQIEVEHVRLTVANFLRFCPEQKQQDRFLTGFLDGLKFWKSFWDHSAKIVLLLQGEQIP